MSRPNILHLAPQIVLLQWQDEPGTETSNKIWQWDAYLNEYYRDELVETVMAYREIALYVRKGIDVHTLIQKLDRISLNTVAAGQTTAKQITLPVCYGGQYGPDLESLSKELGLRSQDLIDLHTAGEYQAAFLGFLPGFAYLNGLVPELHAPRKASPRPQVPAGAVGIGGRQTGIYPLSSPGGWKIIGRCPIPLFQVSKEPAALIAPGSRVKFRPISEAEFELLIIEVDTETFQYQNLKDD